MDNLFNDYKSSEMWNSIAAQCECSSKSSEVHEEILIELPQASEVCQTISYIRNMRPEMSYVLFSK